MSIISNKEILEKVIKESFYKKEVLIKLGYKTMSGNYNTLNKFIKLYKIDINHFLTAKDSIKGNSFVKKYEMEDIFIKDFKGTLSSSNLKKYLYRDGLKSPHCELCGQKEDWFGNKLSFILDHINGNNKDHRIENIRIICPNCDSTLDTYMGRNNKNPNSKRQKNIRVKLENKSKKEIKLEQLKQQLIESNIDFKKKTWGIEVSKLLDKSPQYCLKFIKQNFQDLLK